MALTWTVCFGHNMYRGHGTGLALKLGIYKCKIFSDFSQLLHSEVLLPLNILMPAGDWHLCVHQISLVFSTNPVCQNVTVIDFQTVLCIFASS